LSWLFFFLIFIFFFSSYRNYARDYDLTARDYADLAARDYYDFEPELSRREEELFPYGLMRRDAELHRRGLGELAAGAEAAHLYDKAEKKSLW
jgi:hypothetical protein